MKTKHTPEPWAVNPLNKAWYGVKNTPHNFTNLGMCKLRIDYYPESQANAARIVACINACAGMADPAFEIEFLREQLRECTDALRSMVEATTLECSAANGFYDQRNKAKKVIEDLNPRP